MTHTEWQTVANALRDACLQIQYLNDRFKVTGSCETVLSRLQAAIKIMEAN